MIIKAYIYKYLHDSAKAPLEEHLELECLQQKRGIIQK